MSISVSIRKILPTKVKDYLRIIYATCNWPEVMLVKWGLKKNAVAVFRRGYKFPIQRESADSLDKLRWKSFMSYVGLFREMPEATVLANGNVKFPYRGREWEFFFGKWGVHGLPEIFKHETYKQFVEEFDLKGRTVVDIGAHVGDTSVFWAAWGAKRIYGYEPLPGMFRLAEENMKLNGLEATAQIFLCGVGGKTGSFVEDATFDNLFGTAPYLDVNMGDLKTGEEIPITTLKDIVDKFKIKNAFMKIDCEGFEYDILLNAPNDVLKKFDYIVVEYHYGFENLEKKFLEAGFKVWHTEPYTRLHGDYLKNPQNLLAKDGRKWASGYITARQV
jgi:FkbM family methyltransferase